MVRGGGGGQGRGLLMYSINCYFNETCFKDSHVMVCHYIDNT